MPGAKAAATAAAFFALVVVVAAGAFVAARDDRPAPTTTTTTTTTSTTAATTVDDLARAIASSLGDGLDVPLTSTEARCVADGLVSLLGLTRSEALAAEASTVSDDERSALVRTVVGCLPPDKAAALLGSNPSTTVVAELPGEGTDL